ncbi:MAG: hypothetical protein GXY08_11100 [Ruminococcus sp.]|nr:hypothetical protein [Ruminococcus sp.]
MKIIYFGIQDCKCELIDGKLAIIAPEDVDAERLKEYSFIQLLDGRWCHFMAYYEVNYYMNSGGNDVLIFPPPNASQDQNIVKRDEEKDICITLVLILPFVIGLILFFYSYKISLIIMAASFLGLWISAIRDNRAAAKALIAIIIIIPILFVLYVNHEINRQLEECDESEDKACDTCERIGEMGAQYTYFWE